MQSPSSVITVGQCAAVPSTINHVSSPDGVITDDVGYDGNLLLSGSRSGPELAGTRMTVPDHQQRSMVMTTLMTLPVADAAAAAVRAGR